MNSHLSTSWHPDLMNERHKNIAVGILIGERWTSVASYENGIVTDIIKKMPSVISFTKDKAYFGSDALRHSFKNIANTVYAFFGLLGRTSNDRSVQQLSRHVTYKIRKTDSQNKRNSGSMQEDIAIPIIHGTSKNAYTPIELVSQFLEYLMKKTSRQLNCNIENVSIAVPNTFGQRQRQALIQAAKIAKIPSVRLVTSCLATCVYSRFYESNIQSSNNYQESSSKRRLPHKVQLIMDISHIACSLAIVECLHRKADIVRVRIISGTELAGVSQILNKFSLHVVTRFVEEYQNHHYDIQNQYLMNTSNPLDMNTSPVEEKHHSQTMKQQTVNTTIDHKIPDTLGTNLRPKHRKKLSMADRILNQYSQLNSLSLSEALILEPQEEKENTNENIESEPLVEHLLRQSNIANGVREDENIQMEKSDPMQENQKTIEEKKEEEAMKCRFRARMICANVLEHLHDRYQNNISLHYDGFFSDSSLHLIMKLHTLDELIIKPFVFEIHQYIDKLLQETSLMNGRQKILNKKRLKELLNSNDDKNQKYKNNKKKQRKILNDAVINLDRLQECVITGDGAFIPSITQLIEKYFNINEYFQKKPVIARGAALICAVDQELASQPLSAEILPMSIKLLDPCPENNDNKKLSNHPHLYTLLERYSSCPCKQSMEVTTWMDNQEEIKLQFYEGEGTSPKTCNYIGAYAIRGITKRKKNKSKIKLLANVDRNCLLTISAEDCTDSKNPTPLNITRFV